MEFVRTAPVNPCLGKLHNNPPQTHTYKETWAFLIEMRFFPQTKTKFGIVFIL
jgi:hypothetical protein